MCRVRCTLTNLLTLWHCGLAALGLLVLEVPICAVLQHEHVSQTKAFADNLRVEVCNSLGSFGAG